MHRRWWGVAALGFCLGGCGDDGARDRADTAVTGETAVADETAVTGETAAAEAEVATPLPNISQVLDCGAAPASGPGNSNELQRHQMDTAVFPDALCNDGSVAVFYYRPYVGEENKDRWLINLNGGGGCSSGQSCADRWCWCRSLEGANGCPNAGGTTNFSMANMNSDTRASVSGDGIFRRGDAGHPNPIGNWNQVRVVYCSSDAWSGTRRDVALTGVHPKTGAPIEYAIHFLGAEILDAALATLRRDGVGALDYTFGTTRAMPDLDDASEVIVSGDSAGGSGVITNIDRIAELLRANNTHCAGGAACPLVVRGLADAIVGPDISRLAFDTTTYFRLGLENYDLFTQYLAAVPDVRQGSVHDTSCLDWHKANKPGTEGYCSDNSHVVRHHITTPFFVRMALLDSLISGNYIDNGYSDPELGLMTLQNFAVILQRELAAFPQLKSSAEEGAAMTVAPGVFAPACTHHDTIHSDAEVYGTTLTPAGDTPKALFDVFENWRSGTTPSAVLTMKQTREDTVCGDQ